MLLRSSLESLGLGFEFLQLLLQLPRSLLLPFREPPDGFTERFAIDWVVVCQRGLLSPPLELFLEPPAVVVNDDALGLPVVPEPVHATEALPQAVEARGLGDEGVEVEVRAGLDA